jgi:hypothetical protein
MGLGEPTAEGVAEALSLQAVGKAVVRRGGVHRPAGGQQNRSRNAHGALVSKQNLIRTPRIAEMLVDIDDGLVSRPFLHGLASRHCRRQREKRRAGQELTAREPRKLSAGG